MLQNQDHFVMRVGAPDYRYPHMGVCKCTRCLSPSIDSRDLASERAVSCTRQHVQALGSGITLWAPVTTLGVQEATAHAHTCKWVPEFNASFKKKKKTNQTIPNHPSWPCTGQTVIFALRFEEIVKWFRNPSQCCPCSSGACSLNCKFMSCQTLARAVQPH